MNRLGAAEFEGLLEAVPDAVMGVDKGGVIQFANKRTALLFGYNSDLVGMPLETLLPKSLRLVHETHWDGYNAPPGTRPRATDLEMTALQRNGTVFPVECSLSPMETADGMIVIAAVRDMTRYRREEADRFRLDRLTRMGHCADDAIIGTSLNGTITSWNPAAEKMFGYSSEEIIGRSSDLLASAAQSGEMPTILARILAGQRIDHFDSARVRKDGTGITVSLSAAPIRDASGVIAGISMTARDLAAAKLAYESAQRMAAIVLHSQDAIISSTIEGIVTSWNPAAERLYGYSSQEMIGRSAQIVNPADREGEVKSMLTRVSAGLPVEHIETVRVRKDGKLFPVSVTVSPIRDTDGVVIGASVISRDVSSQRQAYDAARSMIEASLDSFIAISPEGKITDANEATVKLTGVDRDELIGTSFSGYFTDPDKAEQIYQQVFTEGMAVDYPLTLLKRDGDGTPTEVLYNASVFRDISGKVLGVFAAARDVTNQMNARRELAEQQARGQDRMAELESFQRLTVGRELKMIELKKEIELLRTLVSISQGEPLRTAAAG
jgi:PAS domain S-box-containing protein